MKTDREIEVIIRKLAAEADDLLKNDFAENFFAAKAADLLKAMKEVDVSDAEKCRGLVIQYQQLTSFRQEMKAVLRSRDELDRYYKEQENVEKES